MSPANDSTPSVPPPVPAPPPAPAPAESYRMALLLNLALPGMGHFYMRKPIRGLVLATAFTACFMGMIYVFLRAYGTYLMQATGDLMAGEFLEAPTASFPVAEMLGLLVLSLVLFFASFVGLRPPPPRPPPHAHDSPRT